MFVGSKFQNYKSGVLSSGDNGSPNNHAIVLCGWDDATGSWVLRNSSAASWGEQGYMKIKYGLCSVGQIPTYVVYKGGISAINTLNSTNSAIEIGPNPAVNGKFNINGLEKENTIEVYDVVGKLIYKTLSTTTTTAIDLTGNSKGIYLYKIINSDNSVRQGKVVI